MNDQHPIIPGAEPWASPGEGDRARVGAVVVHGFTGNPVSTRPLGEAIAAAGYAVEVLRLPGHGTHWKDLAPARYTDWRGAVNAALDGLLTHCDKVVLVGFSMGGTLVLDVGGARPGDVAGLVTINAAILDREGLLAKIAPLLGYLLPVVPAKTAGLIANDANRPGVDEKAYDHVPVKAANSLIAVLPGIRARLRGLAVPLLGIYGEQDRSVPNANTKALPGLFGGGDVTLLPLPNSRHVAPLDLDRETLEAETVSFIGRVTGI